MRTTVKISNSKHPRYKVFSFRIPIEETTSYHLIMTAIKSYLDSDTHPDDDRNTCVLFGGIEGKKTTWQSIYFYDEEIELYNRLVDKKHELHTSLSQLLRTIMRGYL